MSTNTSDVLLAGALLFGAYIYSRRSMAMPAGYRPPTGSTYPNSLPGNVGTSMGNALGGALGNWLGGFLTGSNGNSGFVPNTNGVSGYSGSADNWATQLQNNQELMDNFTQYGV